MSQLRDSLQIVMKKLESEKSDLKDELKEKFKLIADHLDSKKANDLLAIKSSELHNKIKILREQVEIKESEKIEYEEGDLKSSVEYAVQLKKDLKKMDRQLNNRQTVMYRTYSQSEALINQLLKYKKKIAEIPAIKEADRVKAETTLENKTLKLNAVNHEIKDYDEQETILLAKIEETEKQITQVLAKSEELTQLINVEKSLADKVVQYQEQIIPEIASEIEKLNINISNAEKSIEEKTQSKNEASKAFEDLKVKLQNEQANGKSLQEKMQNILQLKNDIINKKVLIKDIDENLNLSKLALNNEYKKQKIKIRKLAADNVQIAKDAQTAASNKNESTKALNVLKEDVENAKKMLQIRSDEIKSLENDIEGKEVELKSLQGGNLEMTKAIEAYKEEMEMLETNIAELNEKLKELDKKESLTKKKTKQRDSGDKASLRESQLKAIDMKVSINNNKNNVHKWLTGLPQKFSKNSTRSEILSQNSTVQPNDSIMDISTIQPVQSNETIHDNNFINFEIDDPEVIDANVDCSFSEMAGSDIGLDESFLRKD